MTFGRPAMAAIGMDISSSARLDYSESSLFPQKPCLLIAKSDEEGTGGVGIFQVPMNKFKKKRSEIYDRGRPQRDRRRDQLYPRR